MVRIQTCPNLVLTGAWKDMTHVADQQDDDDYLTPEEMSERLSQLSRADLERLKQISGYFARSPQEAEDLRQEAYLRALEGSRRCRRDQPVVVFLAGTMQSISNAARKAAARVKPHKEALEREPTAASPTAPLDPLQALLEQESEFRLAMGKLRLFGNDPVAMAVIEGIMEGFQGAELCELVGITPKELATKRRLVKRRLDAAGGLRK
jgi:DNA-directed RNA polymerase specialized sigma24 family protein